MINLYASNKQEANKLKALRMNYKLSMVAFVSTLILPASASAHIGTHEINTGDSLSKIAADHDTDWNRLYDKNVNIQDPNLIFVGDSLEVPSPTEKLARRALQAPSRAIAPQVIATQKPHKVVKKPVRSVAKVVPKKTVKRVVRGYGGANLFEKYSCVWFVKNWRPEINWSGNANQFAVNARAKGWAVGSTPAVNAIGVTTRGAYGHVVVVTKLLGNGRIELKEGNFDFRGGVRTRTANASEFSAYIY